MPEGRSRDKWILTVTRRYDRLGMKGREIIGGTFVLAGVDLPATPALPPQLVEWRYQPGWDVFVGDQIVDLARLALPPGAAPHPNGGVILHPDVYLLAAQVVDEAESAVEFLNVYGAPSVDPRWTGGLRWADTAAEAPPLLGLPAVDPERAEAIRSEPIPDFGTYDVVTRAAVVEGFRTIRFLVQAWSFLAEGGPAPPDYSDDAHSSLASLFTRVLDSCLAPVCPRAWLAPRLNPVPEWAVGETPPLLSVLALQLAHHIERGSSWSVCANERCGRQFEYQVNRTQRDPNRRRSGSRYCTDPCADAARQRRSKQRRRQHRRGEQD